MVSKILEAAGIPYRRIRFPQPPKETYAVYLESVSAGGADHYNPIRLHDIDIELYEPAQDVPSETALEAALDAAGLDWTKQDPVWLQDTQRYQTVYTFSYYTKRRIS